MHRHSPTRENQFTEHAQETWARFLKVWLALSNLSGQFVTEDETDSLPKRLLCNRENKMNGRSSFSFKLVQVAGSETEMKNFTNPGLAQSRLRNVRHSRN